MERKERIKTEIAREAARLLFEEEVRSYRDARRQAIRHFGPAVSSTRGAHLPEYAEIHTEFEHLLRFYGGETLARRVREWRLLALKYLELLEPFQPLLVGSVQRGEVRELSDINLQLFCDKPEEVGYFFEREGITFGEEGDAEQVRFYLEDEGVEIECAVYPPNDRRQRPFCQITGKSLERADAKKVRAMLGEVV
ncbi:hypothetical protein [Geopsychrobacter electrodiphilus]|uniref:hypothetical protein n=1 Tax=Geopsychrobacter electrodiphilus TaxID=225196 RepID=UPI00036F9C9A|nr:hypothetical protein [Geopsychrobacter electrodiphilus]